ncbi:hypothetical protein [Streptomyces tremellae]|uniref:hypothetical protein n=1 Tax=Streptomyces tremellae TaxID=1124239 RepID=UPI0031EC9285
MNSPFRAAAKMLCIRSATGAGTPCARACSRKAPSVTAVRVKGLPVARDAIPATASKSSAAGPVSGGVGPSNRPSSARIAAVASARSSWPVQATGPSTGRAMSPVRRADFRNSSAPAA